MSPPHVPGVPGTRLPPRDDLEREQRLREEVRRKRESLRYVRKNSPPEGTPASTASTREEAQLLAEISDVEEELRKLRARKGARRSDTQLRPPPEVVVVEAAPAPDPPKPPANYAWLAYVIPPIVTGVAAILGSNYIKKEDFEREFKAQREATAALVVEVDKTKAAQLALALCLEKVIAQDRRFQVVTIASFSKLGIVLKGQTEDAQKVDWKSESMGDPNTGKLPSWSPKTVDGTEILVKTVACPVKDSDRNLFD